ncbi:MAG TPA: ABC transporter substrate-binding protein [Methylomirabilota bacterium]|nr:ABC transporter substrate-binding protein [Methylomirabilota bacterium]
MLQRFPMIALLLLATADVASAQGRGETLIVVTESGPNSMDIHGVGANRPAYQASWNLYDRLMTYGVKTLPDGSRMYDYNVLKPELAESWTLAPDGMSVTFKLRRDAKFHDGTPATARDVKWSFDRAVTVGGFPTFQMKAGSLEKPEQFEVVDDATFRVKLLRKDKLTMPDLAVPVPVIINSELARKHSTAQDPWAMEWLKNNDAGSGAYKLESWKPGQETIYVRFDDWKSGPLPKLKRVLVREVPSAGNRRALLERGDADISFDLPPKDFAEMAKAGKVAVVSHPVENAYTYVGMNVKNAPFSNLKVRQAVAAAIPYEKIFTTAVFGRGVLLSGNPIASLTAGHDLFPSPYKTDLARAKALMAEAGVSNGFETTLSFDQGFATINEPAAVLVQESLAQIGIKTTINKIPGANWRNMLLKKEMPLFVNGFGGWLNYPEYFFFWNLHGQNAVFNTSSYQNPEMDKLIEAARFDNDPKKYMDDVRGFARIMVADVPRVPIYQPLLDVAMQKSVKGYQYWFHRQLDYRQLSKE